LNRLQHRLTAAGAALSEADLAILVIQAEAIMVVRATNKKFASPHDLT
jgi:hypothetical protein